MGRRREMAELVNFDNEVSEFDAVEETVSQREAARQPEQKSDTVLDDVDIPEQYRGKGVKDLVKIVTDQNAMIGRQSQEVGEVRRLADELLKAQLTKKPEQVVPEVDFFENPQEAIRNAIDNSPKVKAAEEYAVMARKQMAMQSLVNKHPDYQNFLQDNEFNTWVQSSKVRQKLFAEANNYDFDAADELLGTFKQLRTVRQTQVSEVEKEARNKSLSAATVDTSGTGEVSKKVYRRADLINLQLTNPRKFEAMRDEINQAYAEKRVR